MSKQKHKMEFSKKLTLSLIIFGCGIIITSFVLVFMEKKSSNEAVTLAVITQIVVTSLSYLLYQYKLKESRNMYGVDENGVPFEKPAIPEVNEKNLNKKEK